MHLVRFLVAHLVAGLRPHDEFDVDLLKHTPRSVITTVLNQQDDHQTKKTRSLGMGYANHEIFMPLWYTQWASALQDSQFDKVKALNRLEEITRFRNKPLPDQQLLSLESADLHRIVQTSHDGLYSEFRYDMPRADGLPSIAHAFDQAQIIKYHYIPPANYDDESNLGTGILSSNITPQTIGVGDFRTRLAKWAREQSKTVIQYYHLKPELVSRYGLFFNITLRYDHTCVQLLNPSTNIRQTRRLSSIFGEGKVFLLDQQSIRGASRLRRQQIREQPNHIINRYTTLDRELDLAFFGFQGDDFIPFDNEGQAAFQSNIKDARQRDLNVFSATEKFAILTLAAKHFNEFCMRARNAMSIFVNTRLFRPPQAAQNIATDMARGLRPNKAGQSLINALAYPGDTLDFRFRSVANSLDAPCSEANLFNLASALSQAPSLDHLVISDLCIQMPHQDLYPLEKFWVQCRGWYPVQTLAYIVVNSKDGVKQSRPNKFDLFQCTAHGWQSVRSFFTQPDPSFMMSFCSTRKIGTLRQSGPDDFHMMMNNVMDSRTLHDVYESSAEKANILNY